VRSGPLVRSSYHAQSDPLAAGGPALPRPGSSDSGS
jgi:hypothetical protein